MKQIANITDRSHQVHHLAFAESEIVLTLRFHAVAQMWTFDAAYKDWSVFGKKLSLGTLHIDSQNMPFDFMVDDLLGTGIDPFKADDFANGRCALFLLEPADMREIRGASVPL